jgi:SulP family sulfate permease
MRGDIIAVPMLPAQLHPFRPRLLDAVRGYDRQRFIADLGAGLTVGVVALPLAMAFAIASGVKPEAGLFTAIIAGFLISALGGSNVQIGGPAGAFIVIVYGIVERYGLANLLIATSMAGLLLIAMGALKLGALVRYIPVSIVVGFTNGIAVLIGLSQIKDLLGLPIEKLPADFFAQLRTLAAHLHSVNPWSVLIGLSCLLIVVVWPKSYTMPTAPVGGLARLRRMAAHLPGTLMALVGATLAVWALELPVETIGTRFGGIPSSLPVFELPDFSWATVKQLLMPTLTIAMLGAIESLLCARVADNLALTPRHDPNQELMAQGAANLITPFFGGIPATGTIARTVTNVRAGARTPVAGIVHAASLLLIVLVAAPLAGNVPLAALAGILMFVAWNMGEWREFAHAFQRYSGTYRTIMIGTFMLTVVFDLTVAVEVGLLMACVFFIWRMSQLFKVTDQVHQHLPPGVQSFELFGSLFWGAVGQIEQLPARVRPGTRVVVLEMHRLLSIDISGLESLRQLLRELRRRDVVLILANVAPDPLALFQRSGFETELGAENIVPSMASLEELDADAAAARGDTRPASGP